MKITVQEYSEAKAKMEKLQTKAKELQATIKTWDDAAKQYGKPREGDEVVAFVVEEGNVEAVTRRIPVPKPAVAS